MDDDEIRSRLDGRGRVETSGGASVQERAEPIAYALGYELIRAERTRGPGRVFGLPAPVTVRLTTIPGPGVGPSGPSSGCGPVGRCWRTRNRRRLRPVRHRPSFTCRPRPGPGARWSRSRLRR
ncbi:hypothetical protein ABZ467_06080 [Streptomyces sp. NPDC005727]|uniref:hypothetical protein n=1 Tax=Streptomyces sp. NPDC005727 TaxID=3157053 RepID=UPI00340AF811